VGNQPPVARVLKAVQAAKRQPNWFKRFTRRLRGKAA
jgi:hypothetical protein